MKIALAVVVLVGFSPILCAYSTLTHEAIIDSVWQDSLQPLLLQRYPSTNEDELKDARKYAYGGAAAEDMGYYPFGSKFFSDLVHYVRSGDFVKNLIRESTTVQEYAFALGALAHYSSDCSGHPLATNRAVPMLYPELREKYGNVVTYEDKPSAHLKVEFGYDVVQVARGSYLLDSFHDFIGFGIAKDLLKRTFQKTYVLELEDQFGSIDLAMGTFRWSVRGLIPEMTKVAWQLKKDEIQKARPDIKQEQFLYLMPRNKYEEEWGKDYRRPGFFARILAFVIRIIPKFGPFKTLAFKPPTPEVEKMFLESYARTVEIYSTLLADEKAGNLQLPNRDLDTGTPTDYGEYHLADKTYMKLTDKLAKKSFRGLTTELRQNILEFFQNPQPSGKIKPKDVRKLLEQLRAMRQHE